MPLLTTGRRTFILTALLSACVLCLATAASAAEPRFTRLLSDHAVLQRGEPVTIRGFAAPGAEVTVGFAGQSKRATADDSGAWSVVLDAMPASAQGRTLGCKTADGATAEVKDVVVGDVILFARQAHIDVSLGARGLVEKVPADPAFRTLKIKTIRSATPRADLESKATDGWAVVDAAAARQMSAAAFYLGRDLSRELDVPVGVIDLDMGHRFTIAWLDVDALLGSDEFYGRDTRVSGYAEWMLEAAERYEAQQRGKTREELGRKWVETEPITDPLYPSAGYNAVLHPMRGLALKAVVLQLGNDYPYVGYERLRDAGQTFDRDALDTAWWENYLNRKQGYRAAIDVLPRVPALWRGYFGNDRLPIGLVTLPSSDNPTYAMHNRETRELHRRTAEGAPGVGVILPGNGHIPFSGQPADDQLVAQRSLAWLLGSAYGKDGVVPNGPVLDRVELDYSTARVFFKDGTAEGLKAAPGALDHFEVAGLDRAWVPAEAEIDGQTIRLSSDAVSRIMYVRYNYNLRPDYGLTNGAGLPALPFVTGTHDYVDVPRTTEEDLPPEYTTPANEWEAGDVAIVSGGGADYRNGEGWLGATGLQVKPFGPNMHVIRVLPGSPAAGQIEVGDMIYRVNGAPLEADHLQQVGRAITRAESQAGGGKIAFAFRRGNDLHEKTLTLEVLGTYSATSPYDCPKADRIIANSEAYLARRGGLSSGAAGGGWLYSETMFLMAAGTPEHQGLVRRFIYNKMREMDKNENMRAGGNAWFQGHGALLFAEYYLATGDRNVLPYLEAYCKHAAAMQSRPGTFEDMPPRSIGGWRHNYPGGQWYGMIPNIGLPAMIGMKLAKEAGVEINDEAYERGMHFFTDGQAEMGHVDYAAVMPDRAAPDPIDPEKAQDGMLYARNGGRGMAAVLFDLEGDTRIAHLNSMYTAFAWNNCHEGHGTNFFNGLWTPIGARLHSKKAFINFMGKHYWYRDLKRMYNHTALPAERAGASVGHDLVLTIPRQRLRMLGAPESVFAAEAPAELQPALDAYYARDYARAQTLAAALGSSTEINSTTRDKAAQLERAASEIQESIAADVAKARALLDEGKVYEARLDLRQLTGVMPKSDDRLASIQQAIDAADDRAMNQDKQRYDALQEKLAFDAGSGGAADAQDVQWQSLTTNAAINQRLLNKDGIVPESEATRWRVNILEAVSQAPEGWNQPGFDDSGWGETRLPISWHLNHAFIARTTFDVDDPEAIQALRVSCHPFRQLNIRVYINGQVVAKFNKCENNKSWVHGELPPAALKHLKKGKNTLAFSTTNDWRWATRGGVDNGGFGLKLDMQPKD